MNLLAFAFHTACDCLETLWQQAKPSASDAERFLSGFPPHLLLPRLCLLEAPHRDSDHRQSCATHIEQQVSTPKPAPRWITRAGPTATHWPSPLKCWVSLRRIAAARKQQVLRLGACPPLFSRTRPGIFPAGRRRKWISHTPPPNRERFTLHSEAPVPEEISRSYAGHYCSDDPVHPEGIALTFRNDRLFN
jgi:hypothetical protein